jgi:hypothetical protein
VPDHGSILPGLPPLSVCGPAATIVNGSEERAPTPRCCICGRTGSPVERERSTGDSKWRSRCLIRPTADSG